MKVKHEIQKSVLLRIYIEGDEADALCQVLREAYTLIKASAKHKPVIEQFVVDVEEQLMKADHRSANKIDATSDVTSEG